MSEHRIQKLSTFTFLTLRTKKIILFPLHKNVFMKEGHTSPHILKLMPSPHLFIAAH